MEQVSIGNVKFAKNDVKSSSVKYENNEKINCVFLKNGTSIEFKDQRQNSGATVVTGCYGDRATYGQSNGTGFQFIDGLKVVGSNRDDYYHLWKCENWDVNTGRGGNDEIRVIGESKHVKGSIHADYTDKISFQNLEKQGSFSGNEGWFFKGEIDPNPDPQPESDIKIHPNDKWKRKVINKDGYQFIKYYDDNNKLLQVTTSKNGKITQIDKYHYNGDQKTMTRYLDSDVSGDCDWVKEFKFENGQRIEQSKTKVNKDSHWPGFEHNNRMETIQTNAFRFAGY